jgi:hypothetical protein
MQKIPALKKGSFLLLSPDEAKKIQQFQVRWLLTKHDVISEDQLNSLIDGAWREKYQKTPDKVSVTKPEIPKEAAPPDEVTPESEMDSSDQLDDRVYVVDFTLHERNLNKALKPHLEHKTLNLIALEKLNSAKFDYYPLLKVKMLFNNKKGIFKKKIEQVPVNLYLDYKQLNILMIDDKAMRFEALIDMDPHKIDDLDGLIFPQTKKRDEVEYDFRKLGKRIDITEVKTLLERKYDVEVQEVDLLLYPVWHCIVQHKQSGTMRELTVDAVMGYPMINLKN